MKIAFPSNDGKTVEEHFGHSRMFVVAEVVDNKEINRVELTPPAHTPGAFPKFLSQQGANAIITGGMGQKAISLFEGENIQVVLGASGSISDNLENFLQGKLESTGSSCSHDHDHQCQH